MRLLVTGAGGMLGREVVDHASGACEAVVGCDRAALDVGDAAAVSAVVGEVRPDAIVNCAAFTAVDRCETEVDTAYRVNRDGVAYLAAAAQRVGARVVHVSTDYVFDGTKATGYVETDAPNPQSVYGASKLAGEAALFAALPDGSLVVRTAWVFGQHGANMVKTVLRVKDTSPTLRFVDDQRGSPTSAADLAQVLVRLAGSTVTGVVHATNAGAVSWFEFVREILRQCGDDPGRVEPISSADLDPPRPAPRPANSVLDNRTLRALGWPALRPYEAALADVLAQLH
jgi:dTDP-4-dehydrorhamnose reductase